MGKENEEIEEKYKIGDWVEVRLGENVLDIQILECDATMHNAFGSNIYEKGKILGGRYFSKKEEFMYVSFFKTDIVKNYDNKRVVY